MTLKYNNEPLAYYKVARLPDGEYFVQISDSDVKEKVEKKGLPSKLISIMKSKDDLDYEILISGPMEERN